MRKLKISTQNYVDPKLQWVCSAVHGKNVKPHFMILSWRRVNSSKVKLRRDYIVAKLPSNFALVKLNFSPEIGAQNWQNKYIHKTGFTNAFFNGCKLRGKFSL